MPDLAARGGAPAARDCRAAFRELAAAGGATAVRHQDGLLARPDVPLAAPNLTCEIPETAALASPDVAERFSGRVAELGAGHALDDFGTGYGSFTELRILKLHSLKIDPSFVRNLASNPDDQRDVKLIIHIAKEFGSTTTAEGVEDVEALALLLEYRADRAQGFLIGKPAPVQP